LWFRNDLRLHDNEALSEAIRKSDFILPVFIFDPKWFEDTDYGFKKTGIHRASRLIEAVTDLKTNLQAFGSDLFVAVGDPVQIIYDLANKYKSSWVFCNRERTYEEVIVQNNLEKKLWTIGQEIWYFRGKMLIHTADLPFPVTHTPDSFAQFRKEVEGYVDIREPLPIPETINPLPKLVETFKDIPQLEDLGFEMQDLTHEYSVVPLAAGETNGLKRLNDYLFVTEMIQSYKDTKGHQFDRDVSSKFSYFLSLGCLSPKKIYWELKKYEQTFGATDSTHSLFLDLLWRDFYRFQAKKYGNQIFKFEGTHGQAGELLLYDDQEKFDKWRLGQTGVPFVDANMRELLHTGYISNRGRQNVASFLINEYKVNWLWGAAWFESMLIDYDPCSNYGNWACMAGVGCDTKQDRHLNVVGQGKRYDPHGVYIKSWVPELRHLLPSEIHETVEFNKKATI
jgi:deoxyribodipyrimidine photo-lyase